MAKMTTFEKWFVNKRGEGTFVRLLDKLETSGVIHINGSSRILELGGGNGAFSSVLYKRYRPLSINLTDFDPDQLTFAKKSLERKYGNLPTTFELKQADALHLPFGSESFDIVIAHLILHHLGGKENIFTGLDEVSRVLTPGGTFIYLEFALKDEIAKHLMDLGFGITFRKGINRETVVAVKPSKMVS